MWMRIKKLIVKVLFNDFLILILITIFCTSLIFAIKAKAEGIGEKAHFRNHSNFLTPVKLFRAQSQHQSIWGIKNNSLKYKQLSALFPINYNSQFPTVDSNTEIQKYAIPLSVPLRIRICANLFQLKSGLFYIEESKSKFTFAALVGKHRVELTEIENDNECLISQKLVLIESINGVLALKKITEIFPSDTPFHFSGSSEKLIILTKNGHLRILESHRERTLEKRVFKAKHFSDLRFANLGVKSVYLQDEELYIAAAISEDDCGHIIVRELSLESLKQREIYRSDCYHDVREVDSNFWTDMNGSGGRLTESPRNPGNLLLSVGQAEIWQGSEPVKVNKNLGILIELNLSDGKVRIISRGHRNVQGICSINGKILVSEQGPQGGDELNWVIRNGNYGWPYESYGRPYGVGASFPTNRKFGQHENPKFIKPFFAWLPSIAISDLACPRRAEDFNNFYILGATLKDQSVHLLKLSRSRVIYDERIFIGERIRNIEFDFERLTGLLSTDLGNVYEFSISSY
jgi:glucose/arabinose dehydrogenase